MKRLGFIGLGAMGLPMARNLAAAGFELAIFDVDAERTRAAATPLAHAARQLYDEGSEQGLGREDDSGVIRLLEDDPRD